MISDWRKFSIGLIMMIVFFVVLGVMFMPIFHGHNSMEYLDNLYNSISKGSAYYIPKAKEEIEHTKGSNKTLTMELKDEKQASQSKMLFEKAGAQVTLSGKTLTATGDFGAILESSLQDSDAIYHNDGEKVSSRYGYDERQAMYNWSVALESAGKNFQKQKDFKSAKDIEVVMSKAISAAYNYYKVEPQHISDKVGIVILSLVFYVVYTLWYGFGILYLFEGWGMKLEH
jgi:hypothetical protein